MKKYYIIILYLFWLSFNVTGQTLEQKYHIINTVVTGTVSWEARDYILFDAGFSYDANSMYELFASVNPNLLTSSDYRTSGEIVDPTDRYLNKDLPVGNSPAMFNVTPMGSANYTIPIKVAPGTAGMQPELVISYNSMGGDGICGFGVNFSGLSAITRVPRTVFHDGIAGSVNLNSLDRFALNGQRLMVTAGSYGSNNSTYRLEVDNFTDIKAVDLNGDSNPESFEVTTKNGAKMYYGKVDMGGYNYTNSYLLSSGDDIIAWYLYKVEDIHGNFMLYNYERDATNGETWLTSIDYTGNNTIGMSPYNKVEFTYEERSDASSGYIAGKIVSRKKLLKNIRTYGEGQLFRKYEMYYFYDDFPKLNEVVEYNGVGEYYNSIVLGWGDDAVSTVSTNGSRHHVYSSSLYYFGDFNGDGLVDYLRYFYESSTDKMKLKYFTNTGLDFNEEGWSYSWDGDEAPEIYIYPGDFNGDGLTDLLVAKKYWPLPATDWQYDYRIAISTGSGFNFSDPYLGLNNNHDLLFVGDFDADGRAEFAQQAATTNLNFYEPNTSDFNQNPTAYLQNIYVPDFGEKPIVLDINGDGRDEFLAYNSYSHVYNLSTSGATELFAETFSAKKYYFGDFNGDRNLDILYWQNSGTWGIKYFTGNSLIDGTGPSLPNIDMEAEVDDNNLFLRDVNGDGKTDVIYTKQNGSGSDVEIQYSNGNGFTTKVTETVSFTPYKHYYRNFFDINGDGIEDIFYQDNNSYFVFAYFNKESRNNRVENILDGSNSLLSIDYDYMGMTSPSYTKGAASTYPLVTIQPNLMVVQGYTKTNGTKTVANNSYHYERLIAHSLGKGLLGFEKFKVTDNLQGVEKTDEHTIITSKYYPYLSSSTTKKGTQNLVESSSYVTLVNTTSGAFWPKVNHTNNLDVLNNVRNTTEYATYDSYGNPEYAIQKSFRGTTEEAKVYTSTTYGTLTDCNYPTVPLTVSISQFRGSERIDRTQHFYYANNKLDYKITDKDTDFHLKEDYSSTVVGLITGTSIYDKNNNQLRSMSYGYDSRYRFQTEVKNSLNHSAKSAYDVFGKLLMKENASGLKTNYYYDTWGNLVQVRNPDSTWSTATINWYPDNETEFSGVSYYKYTTTNDGSEGYEYFDNLGRPVYTKGRGFGGEWIFSETNYDNLGRIMQEVFPHKEGETPHLKNYTHDEYNRISTVVAPLTNISYDYSEIGKVKITDNLGNKGTVWKQFNSMGEIITAHDNGGEITYSYNPDGTVKEITAPGGTTTVTYDLVGNQLTLSDPSSGVTNYTYDVLGQLKSQTDARGNTYRMYYDELGRVTAKATSSSDSTVYSYISSGNGLGQISNITNNETNITYSYAYDEFGRVISQTENIENVDYTYTYEFENARLSRTVYPSGFAIRHEYDEYGYLNEVTEDDGSRIWELTGVNSAGQHESVEYGNGLTSDFVYDSYNMPNEIRTFTSGGTNMQHLTYSWDNLTGNLLWRQDVLKGLREDFTYDNLDRLVTYQVVGQQQYSLAYDNANAGRIESKTGLGDYKYDYTGKPYTLSAVAAETDITSFGNNQSITYTAFNKVETLSEGSNALSLVYGPDNARKVTELTRGSVTKKKIFAGGLYEKETVDGVERVLTYVPGIDGEVAIYVTEGGISQMYYIHKDYLGSYQTITDESGAIATLNGDEQVYSFDPWGRRRNASNWTYASVSGNIMFDRGFTGHEHLDEFDLINMNGRVCDPYTNMFLSPDPYTQAPGFTQNYNRFGYAFNNPFKYTDPSGEVILGFLKGLWDMASSGGLEFWNWNDKYTHDAWAKADPTLEGTAANNAYRIWKGYLTGPDFWRQLPQNTMGLIGSHGSNLQGKVEWVRFYDGSTVVKTNQSELLNGKGGHAITLGNFIIGDNTIEADPYNALFQHEFGHVLQSREAGWGYLGQFGIPSLFSKTKGAHRHVEHPVEQDANVRAYMYFMDKVPNYSGWRFGINEIMDYNYLIPNHYNDLNNQQILESLRIKVEPWRIPILHAVLFTISYRHQQP